MKKIRVDVYDQTLHAFDNAADVKRFCTKNGYDYEVVQDVVEGAFGCAGMIPSLDDNEQDAFFLLIKTPSIPLLAHEAVHAAMFMLTCVDVSFSFEEQEPLAYLVEYIIKDYCRQFKLLDQHQF